MSALSLACLPGRPLRRVAGSRRGLGRIGLYGVGMTRAPHLPPCLVALLTVVVLVAAGCAGEEAPRPAGVDDGAVPVGSGGPVLSGGFDRSMTQLQVALPAAAMDTGYSEVQELQPETLVPSEATGCHPDAIVEPALPATELLGTRPPAKGRHQPTIGDVVAARAPSEVVVTDLFEQIAKGVKECASFSSNLKDLGEGSFAPGERGSASSVAVQQGNWSGVRVTTLVTLTGKGWTEDVVRQSLVLSKGQIVVHVRVEEVDATTAGAQTDALMTATLATLDPA